MQSGKLIEIAGKYVVEGLYIPVNKNDLYYTLIPNDIVNYTIEDGIIVIESVAERKSVTTIAIIRGIVGKKRYLYCPLISKIYNPHVFEGELYDRILCTIDMNAIIFNKNYGSIFVRSLDTQCLIDLYTQTIETGLSIKPVEKIRTTLGHYCDHTNLESINIDPTQSTDFDDAFSVDLVQNCIYIHIVDIYHHLVSEPQLFQMACLNGFTLYLSSCTKPLFPESKVNNEWSLIKGAPRNVITTKVIYNPEDYTINRYEIYPSTIKITHRYDYEQVGEIFRSEPLSPTWTFLKKWTEKWQKSSLDIRNVSLDIANDDLIQIRTESSSDLAHKLIETLMIMNNVIISKHLTMCGIKVPQRFHSKLRDKVVVDTGHSEVDALIEVKTFSKAIYDLEQKGHFGLELDEYTHFTSPMRRIIDVIIHQLLSGCIYDDKELEKMIDYWNMRKILVDKIVKLEKQWKILNYLSKNIIQVPVYIYRVVQSGIYFYIPSMSLDGYIHVSKLIAGIRWQFLDEMLVDINGKYCIKVGDQYLGTITNISIATLSWEVALDIKS